MLEGTLVCVFNPWFVYLTPDKMSFLLCSVHKQALENRSSPVDQLSNHTARTGKICLGWKGKEGTGTLLGTLIFGPWVLRYAENHLSVEVYCERATTVSCFYLQWVYAMSGSKRDGVTDSSPDRYICCWVSYEHRGMILLQPCWG